MKQVQLLVIDGLHAGTIAPLQVGHYLVGRTNECQIRPEDRKVSRRHCLLWNTGELFGVVDLESSWGTFVNDARLTPNRWKILNDGDVLRVVSVSFRVKFLESVSDVEIDRHLPSKTAATNTRNDSETPTIHRLAEKSRPERRKELSSPTDRRFAKKTPRFKRSLPSLDANEFGRLASRRGNCSRRSDRLLIRLSGLSIPNANGDRSAYGARLIFR